MKRIFTLTVFLLFLSMGLAPAQSLSFNQVIDTVFSGSVGTNSPVLGTVTVPQGKVWKITSASYQQSNSGKPTSSGISHWFLYVDHHMLWGGNYAYNLMPVWLREGTYNIYGYAGGSGFGSASLSILEFNTGP